QCVPHLKLFRVSRPAEIATQGLQQEVCLVEPPLECSFPPRGDPCSGRADGMLHLLELHAVAAGLQPLDKRDNVPAEVGQRTPAPRCPLCEDAVKHGVQETGNVELEPPLRLSSTVELVEPRRQALTGAAEIGG